MLSFSERLHTGVVIGDGAMGTMLYQQGVFLNACFDELNLTNPKLVGRVHGEYAAAVVDFLETNTFGASEFKLAKFGLADKVEAINRAGVEIARAAAGDNILVGGAVGPLGMALEPYGILTQAQARQAFKRQIAALVAAGVDFLIFETFSNPDEILAGVQVARELAPGLPIVAQLTVNEYQETIYGKKISEAILPLAQEPAVTALGLNCSIGPAIMLTGLDTLRQITDKPISLQPNAGLPRQVEGRMLYMSTPEYMAEYAKRFLEKGARIFGGCCGTTPQHLREIAKAVRPLARITNISQVREKVYLKDNPHPAALPEKPLAEKSQIGAKLATGKKVLMIEMTPPRGVDLAGTLEKARKCAAVGIDAINIPDGPRASSRLSPMVTAVQIQREAGIEAVLHVCCRDRNIIGMQSDMLGAYAIGLKNVLLITGDPPKMGEYPDATAVFDLDSIALTRVVRNLNRGLDIGGNSFAPPLALTLGVGANPVAADLKREIERFREKAAAGAEYAITQPVFDERMLFDFLDAVADCKIPIIAGIWPFTSFKNAEFMANEVPGVVVPPAILERMSRATTREEGRRLGIEIAREMVETIGPRVAGFAVSAPFGNVETALEVLKKI